MHANIEKYWPLHITCNCGQTMNYRMRASQSTGAGKIYCFTCENCGTEIKKLLKEEPLPLAVEPHNPTQK